VPVDAYSEWTDVESALATFTRAKERHEKNEKEG
jgi:transcription elongation factor Elf1